MLKKLSWQLGRSMKKEVLKMTSTFTLIFFHIITRVTQDRFIYFGNRVDIKKEKTIWCQREKHFQNNKWCWFYL